MQKHFYMKKQFCIQKQLCTKKLYKRKPLQYRQGLRLIFFYAFNIAYISSVERAFLSLSQLPSVFKIRERAAKAVR